MSTIYESPIVADLVTSLESGPVNPGSAPVLVSWSSRETLLHHPEFACLAIPDVTLVRLPVSMAALRHLLGSPRAPVREGSEFSRLLTPVGQWRWAIDRLEETLMKNNRREAALRLEYLRRFAGRWWPAWYDSLLGRLNTEMLYVSRCEIQVSSIFRKLRNPAIPVAAACTMLLNWTGTREEAAHISEMQDAICYEIQGMTKPLAFQRPDWDKLQSAIDKTHAALDQIIKGGVDIPTSAGECLACIDNSVSRLRDTNVSRQETLKLLNALMIALGNLDTFIEGARRSTILPDEGD